MSKKGLEGLLQRAQTSYPQKPRRAEGSGQEEEEEMEEYP